MTQLRGELPDDLSDDLVEYIRALEDENEAFAEVLLTEGDIEGEQEDQEDRDEQDDKGADASERNASDRNASEREGELVGAAKRDVPVDTVSKAVISKMEQQIESLRQEIEKRDDREAERVFISKAAEWANFPIDSQQFGPILKRVARSVSEADYNALEAVLDAANYTIGQGNIFKEYGSSAPSESRLAKSDADAALERKVESLLKKNPDMTRASAMTQVLSDDPTLYDQHLKEG